MAMSVTFSGGDQPSLHLDTQSALAAWADEVQPVVTDALKAEAPVGNPQTPPGGAPRPAPGRMRDSIRAERKAGAGSLTLTFLADGPIPGYVIDGTQAHDIPPGANKSYLYFMGSGGPAFVGPAGSGRVVHHPGTSPNPFPTRAITPLLAMIEQRLAAAFADQLSA